MQLEEYMPKSCLEVPAHQVPTPKYPVVDMHTHWGKLMIGDDYADRYDTGRAVAALRSAGIRRVVNLDLGFGDERRRMLEKLKGYEDFFLNYGTVDVSRFEEKGFESMVHHSLTEGVSDFGMRGVKLWKPIGLGYRDSSGAYLRPDDPRLKCIFETAASLSIPVLFHIADPVAFFSPVDRTNERYEELCQHPDWSFADPKFYRFHALMEMMERMIADNPRTTFIMAHVASYAENLRQVGAWLDRYPNMYVDIAARIAEMGRQPYTAKAFLEAHCERVFFGTDYAPTSEVFHPNYFRFLETMDEYFNPEGDDAPYAQGRWNIYGVGLSDHALESIYCRNAERLFGY
ncbi:MAG: amidohydrolase family protein [Clostridia bacterium]|nr:amidohydrolase family protein [Clostridia bacterium]